MLIFRILSDGQGRSSFIIEKFRIMNIHSPILIFTIFLLCFLKILNMEFTGENLRDTPLKSLKNLEKLKTETLQFYDLSKPFSKENDVFEIQEARRRRIELFCAEQRNEDFLPQDPFRFIKAGAFFCSLQDDRWLNPFSFRISQKMPKFESSYTKLSRSTANDAQVKERLPAYIMTEDPIRRFLKYYHTNARTSTY